MSSIYDNETASTPDYEDAYGREQYLRGRAMSQAGQMTEEERAAAAAYEAEHYQRTADKPLLGMNDFSWGGLNEVDAARQAAYNTYVPGGEKMYEGGGLFNPNSALFGGSGSSAEMAYGDIESTTSHAIDANRWANQGNAQRYAGSTQYGQQAIAGANSLLGGAADEFGALGSYGAQNALAMRGVSGPGTEGLDIQRQQAGMLGLFDPSSGTAADVLSQQTQNNASAMRAIGLSGRGGGANASAQARGNALAQGVMAGEGLQQQQLAAQEYQSNQALMLQALQGQASLGASQQAGALGNAQFAQQQQAAAAGAQLAGLQNVYGAGAAANQLRLQQADNTSELAKQQQQLAGGYADTQQTLGQVSANYLGQAQDYHQGQLGTEAQLRTQGLINASQTKAGLDTSLVNIRSNEDIQNQAANTAMMGSMLSTGAAAVSGAAAKDED